MKLEFIEVHHSMRIEPLDRLCVAFQDLGGRQKKEDERLFLRKRHSDK